MNKYKSIRSIKSIYIISFTVMLLTGCSKSKYDTKPDDLILLPVDTLNVSFEIGEEIGDSSNMFWSIIAVDIDEHGRVYVLDGVDASLRIYDKQGFYIRHIARRGSGPGELLYPRGMAVFPDGRIIISAPGKGGYVVFNEFFEFEEEVSVWQNNSPYHIAPLMDSTVVACRYDENAETNSIRHTVGIYHWGEEYWETLLWKDSMVVSLNEAINDPSSVDLFCMYHLLKTVTDSEGNIYFAPLDPFEYRIIKWDSSGNELLNIARDMTPVEKNPEEYAEESAYINAISQTMWGPQPWEIVPARYKNMIVDIGIGPDENLWVRRGTTRELFFDIYNDRGDLISHSLFPAESFSWQTKITPSGILAWELDPEVGYQKLYLLE